MLQLLDGLAKRFFLYDEKQLSTLVMRYTRQSVDPFIDKPFQPACDSTWCHTQGQRRLIPIPSHDIPWTGTRLAQLRVHSERIALGIWVNLFHASQQASTMCS